MIVYSKKYLEHNQESHPENNERLESVMELLTEKGVFEKLPLVEPGYAARDDILRVHTPEHFEAMKRLSDTGGGTIGYDTYVTEKTFDVAMLSAGGVLTCVDEYFKGHKYSFALNRPPGHHAKTDNAMGFCIFNNIAIGARYAMERYDLKKVAIFDFDVHHGNGTQEIFYKSPDVIYLSTHQYPHYPGTGSIDETGEGEGEGYTVNVPLPPNTDDDSYLTAVEDVIVPALDKFKPELIFVSAGYDGHLKDPLGGMNLTPRCYFEMVKTLRSKFQNTGMVFGLEGGYDLTALANSVYASLEALFDI
jgi:acetoin utilization deacetylase AcuC-like enzyme